MSKKLLFLISFVLALSLAGSASAQDATHVCFWSNLGDSNLWSDANNWYTVDWNDVCDTWVKSAANSVPTLTDAACIGQGGDWFPYPNALTALPPIGSCLIDSSVTAECYQLWIDANSLDPNQPSHLEMTGGSLTIRVSADDWVGLGIGWLDDGNGSMTVSGNSIVDISFTGLPAEGGNLSIGGYGTGTGTMTMDGNCTVYCYHLDCTDSPTSEGHLNLYGGTLYTTADEDWTEFWMGVAGDSPNSTIDITDGKAIIISSAINETGPEQELDWINLWIDEGKITAFGGAAPRAEIYADYDITNPGKTTLQAIATELGQAWRPNPRPGGAVDYRPTLTWAPGDYVQPVNEHIVYFSTDRDAVVNGTAPNTTRDVNYFNVKDSVGLLDWTTSYYWAVDEVNDPCKWPGLVWSFKTSDHLAVEDADSYADHAAMWNVWREFNFDPGGLNRAELFVETTPDYIRSRQSMRYYYRNFTSAGKWYYSEAEANAVDLEIGTDWVSGGVEALVVYFYGSALNGQEATKGYTVADDQMWLALKDGGSNEGIVRLPDMNDVKGASWHEWNIDLQDPCFSGVDMNDVVKVYIGFGGPRVGLVKVPGAGSDDLIGDTVWFDDIGLYPLRCVPMYAQETDVSGSDCITGYPELDILAADWLKSGYDVAAQAPNSPLVHYTFDIDSGTGIVVTNEGSLASAGNGTFFDLYNKGPGGPLTWETPGANHPNATDPNYCIQASGYDEQAVIMDSNLNDVVGGGFTTNTITISAWVKRTGDQLEWTGLVFSSSPLPTDDPDPHAGLSLGANDDWTAGGTDPAQNHVAYHWATVPDANDATPDGEDQIWWWRSGLLVPDGVWTFCAVAIQPEEASVYMMPAGGSMQKSTNIETHLPTTFEDPFNIGRDPRILWGSRTLNGQIDDVQIFDYALTDSEILYAAGLTATHIPVPSEVDFDNSDDIDFADYVFIANDWLLEVLYPPRP